MYESNQTTNGYHKFIEQSVIMLEKHLEEIPNVIAWAAFMGFSRSYFCTSFTRYFGETPSEKLRSIRYKRVHKVVLRYPHESSNSITKRIGLNNEQALYKFLSRHYDTNFTKVRNKLLNGSPPPEASETM